MARENQNSAPKKRSSRSSREKGASKESSEESSETDQQPATRECPPQPSIQMTQSTTTIKSKDTRADQSYQKDETANDKSKYKANTKISKSKSCTAIIQPQNPDEPTVFERPKTPQRPFPIKREHYGRCFAEPTSF